MSASSLIKNLRRSTSEQAEGEGTAAKDAGKKETQAPSEPEVKDFLSDPKRTRKEFTKQKSGRRSSRSVPQNLKISSKTELGTVLESVLETTKDQKVSSKKRSSFGPKWLGDGSFEQTGVSRDPVSLNYNKILQEVQDDLSENRLSSDSSSDLLDSLRVSDEGTGPEDGKSILKKSIEATRKKRKVFGQSLMSNKTEMSLSQKTERKWVERNLEDLEKNLSEAEPTQTKADPELDKKIKDILSELKVAPNQLGTAKTIVTAVESWGKTAFNLSQNIMDEYKEQAKEVAFDPSEFSFMEGDRLHLFDSVLHDVKAKSVKVLPDESTYLMQSDYLEEAKKIDQIGVWQNAFRDEMKLSDRLWQYPVDNEVVKMEEEGVSFEEHVFLEYLLDDFPIKGPVRRFMELVINGLQQNPHLTVAQKKERVRWFKEYFSNLPEEELNF